MFATVLLEKMTIMVLFYICLKNGIKKDKILVKLVSQLNFEQHISLQTSNCKK